MIDECLLVGGEARRCWTSKPVPIAPPGCGYFARPCAVQACLRVRGDKGELPAEANALARLGRGAGAAGRPSGGVLVELPAKGKPASLHWQAVNCLYAGWKERLTGGVRIDGSDRKAWEACWPSANVEKFLEEGWPAATFPDLESVAAAEYRTDTAPGVRWATPALPGRAWPTGKETRSAPPRSAVRSPGCRGCATTGCRGPFSRSCRHPWTCRPILRAELPAFSRDNLYHGERFDVSRVDVGAHLEQMKKNYRLAPVVVLRLYRSGEVKQSSPLRLKGVSLVLVLEPFEKPKSPPDPPGVPPPPFTRPGPQSPPQLNRTNPSGWC